jgi:hypothetical protein
MSNRVPSLLVTLDPQADLASFLNSAKLLGFEACQPREETIPLTDGERVVWLQGTGKQDRLQAIQGVLEVYPASDQELY